MKKLIALKLATAILLFSGCSTNPVINTTEHALFQAAISEGLRYGVKDTAKRTVIANYADDIAAGLRTITGAPTTQQLTDYVLGFVPADIRAQYPEIATLLVPLIVTQYQTAYDQYKNNPTALYAAINGIATDIEAGVAPYVHK